jgi:hypothetical protein
MGVTCGEEIACPYGAPNFTYNEQKKDRQYNEQKKDRQYNE